MNLRSLLLLSAAVIVSLFQTHGHSIRAPQLSFEDDDFHTGKSSIKIHDKESPSGFNGALCSPPCQNGGICLTHINTCQCAQEFKGPQCQYSSNTCSSQKFKFNGIFNCSEESGLFACAISCPEGVDFEFPSAPLYLCNYADGRFEPEPIPQCSFDAAETVLVSLQKEREKREVDNDINIADEYMDNNVLLEKQAHPGSCFMWSGSHIKTFDGEVFSFSSSCAHTLVRDAVDDTFAIVIQDSQECLNELENCYRIVKIYLQDKEYLLKRSAQNMPIFASEEKVLSIPSREPGIRAEMSSHYIVILLDSIGAKIKWDGEQFLQVEVKEALWNRTSGLCGKIDGDRNNDLFTKENVKTKSVVTLVSSWQVDTVGDECKNIAVEKHKCKSEGGKRKEALKFCKKLLSDKRFAPCQMIMDIRILFDACIWDYCSCKYKDPKECACETLNIYVRECAYKGVTTLTKWRDEQTCPIQCSGGKVYMPCAPAGGQALCGGVSERVDESAECEEDCYCPEGTVFYNSKCVTKENCPCVYHGEDYPSGATVPKDCNTCTCVGGNWICTEASCNVRCTIAGDPHYTTFDGKRYDFMGACSYYLVVHDNFTIEMENVACGSGSKETLPSCAKTVTVKTAGQTIKLKQRREVAVNGQEVTKIPFHVVGVTIRAGSSNIIIVQLPNGVEMLWDGATTAYVDVPPSCNGQTKGLCGTYNTNQNDDFLTPEGDVEQSATAFANKWKTSEKCGNVPESVNSHPCTVSVHNKPTAEEHCKIMKSDLFSACHQDVDPEPLYQNCMYDMCSCNVQLAQCLCPMIAAYAAECALKGIKVEWRNYVRECGFNCPSGQKYQICGNSCARSCYDIATLTDCRQQCIEGCNCPEGEALDDNGECIPIRQCNCHHDGLDFPAGYKEIRPASKAPKLCTCINAQWSCQEATPEEIEKYPNVHDLKTRCNANENKEFTTCEPVEPVTCKNMHSPELVTNAICHAGCQCKQGYVFDSSSKTCVKPTECPCHHGGQSYSENSVVQSDCNVCTCTQGKWKCTDKICTGECTTWGDSHYKTFDGKLYDYQGQCDYILAKGSLGNDQAFDVSIQNVPCGSLGVSCSKSVTVRVGTPPNQESITLTREKTIPEHAALKQLIVRQKGHYVIMEAPELGVLVQWDKGTRVYVKLYPQWKNRVKGLCGNYNDNQMDDFQTPSGGTTEASSILFGDSWRLHQYCPKALEVTDTCEQRPDRKIWAMKKCGILKSSVFAACHSEVPVETYLDHCIFDACACDQGGDCECLCTALAAYAQECNNKGIPIRWRTPELCPMQCDERCAQYSPCISTCPTETCDNMLIHAQMSRLCHKDTCIEGCQIKPCQEGFIYSNSSLLECIPKKVCVPLCLEINGVAYYEGDLIDEDECHSCYCSRGKKICQGQPCTTTLEPIRQDFEKVKCISGWTVWINQDEQSSMKDSRKLTDVEPLPESVLMNNLEGTSHCEIKNMVDIECRTVDQHIYSKETGLDAECSLESGLICKPGDDGKPCPDFEIRVKCSCGEETTTTAYVASTELTRRPYELCNITKPNQEHPSDCRLFYHCQQGKEPKLVEESCEPDMLFNPEKLYCDHFDDVVKIKPECKAGVPICPPGEEYRDCAIECNRLCAYYLHIVKQSGRCNGNTECESGCVSSKKQHSCPSGMFWTNSETCVAKQDCMCLSHDNKAIKPGVTVKESDCKVCQCIDNYYTCDESLCVTSVTPHSEEPLTSETNIFLVFSTTVTPPAECSEEDFINLIDGDVPLFDEAFSASSTLSKQFSPKYARLDSTGASWVPESSDKTQYLQITLPQQEPVYGVIIKGSPSHDEFVTSYRVLYSADGATFSVINNQEKTPKTFRGSMDGDTPIKEMFDVPVEAKIIRINPQTWHKGIALRVELIGCSKISTIAVPVVKPKPHCSDPMGVNDGMMADQQISVSSELDAHHGKKQLKIRRKFAWQPATNSPSEWVQFDFIELRNITGLATRGGRHGWITAFNVKYSHDGKDWNPVLDDKGHERTFLGNVDEYTWQITNFDLPLRAKLLKIIPTKWHKNIQLRVEPYGCFVPYPAIVLTTPEVPTLACNNCPGVVPADVELSTCRCKENLWWDGDNCVERTQCPCMVGHIPYATETIFENEDCAQCVCKLGGVSHCTPKVCNKCEKDLRSVVTSTCGCICQPCESGTVLCPTSNICINSTDWCNGVKDCADDETGCTTPPTLLPTTEATIKITTTKKRPKKVCETPTCADGYKVVMKKVTSEKLGWNRKTMFTTHTKTNGIKAANTKGGATAHNKFKEDEVEILPNKSGTEEEECPLFDCVSTRPPPVFPGATKEPCPEIFCPSGYILEESAVSDVNNEACPRYECKAPPEVDAVCNVTGRTFNTFDETEFKHDVCNHILVRDLEHGQWKVSITKNCAAVCTRDLIIQHEDHIFNLHSDLSIDYDGYRYTIEHTKKIGSHSNLFAVSQLGEALVFVSNKYGFWVIWDNQANAKIGVSSKLLEKADGLCGYFNDEPKDDKRKPDGIVAKTTAEFGDSWAESDQSVCEVKACPKLIQNKAWEMCNLVRGETFASCGKAVDLDAFVSRCLETTCTCLETALESKVEQEKCRCLVLQRFVVDCLTANSELDVIDWRLKHDCPATCEAPLVHHDCYRRRCEPSCGSLNTDVCPKLNHVCFPGCYCPPGYVRKDENCILPTSCGDCECNVLPHLEYVTFDERNFTINGNCVYVMSQDSLGENDKEHRFQILVTNKPCDNKKDKMCVGKVTILHEGHKIDITRNLPHNKLKVRVDSKTVVDFASMKEWAHLETNPTKHLRILLHKIQIHVSIYYPSLGVSIKAPSLKYGTKLEGLCGDCDSNPNNDFHIPGNKMASNVEEFGLSWLYGDQNKEECVNQPEEVCKETLRDFDPCSELEKAEKYRQCNPVLNPTMFIDWCRKDTCNDHLELSCDAIEAYSLECGHLGFCIDWRTDLCPAKQCPSGQEHKPCAPACSQTCEASKQKEMKCTNPPVEGCFCPEGEVLLNDTCVVEERCEACDDEGHRSGDTWQEDVCTTCTCEGMNVKCETQKCPTVETICEEGFEVQKVSRPAECCDKFMCVQIPQTTSETCKSPQQQSCGIGQITKLIKKADGCQQFICECMPLENCDPIDTQSLETSEPGIVKKIDETGCCPVVIEKCKEDLCPKPPTCPQFHSVEKLTVDGRCCPSYSCKRPKSTCIVDLQYIASDEGGERPRMEKEQVLKKNHETWQDGPCRACKCIAEPNGDHHSMCSITECPALAESIDHHDYLLELEPVVGQCCPNIKKVACKHNGRVYRVGEKWALKGDSCTTMECVSNSLGIQKLTEVQTCDTKCELGREYIPALPESNMCCGSCKPVACVVDGNVVKIGTKWTSPDYCTNYFCSSTNGSVQIQSAEVNCPTVSTAIMRDYVVEALPVEGECCESHKVVACKAGDTNYKVGETWPSPDGNLCKTIKCTENELGEIVKRESVETCKANCSEGWEYRESYIECCGKCIQVACVVDKEQKDPGETWKSPDGCTTYFCDVMGDQFTVITQQESCPNIDKCPPEDIYSAGCCKHCNITSRPQVSCGVEEIDSVDTIGLISTVQPNHGRCANTEVLKGFTECVGMCKSYTSFNSGSGQHESVCSCCRVTQYQPFVATLQCEDGHRFKKQVAIPAKCGCEACVSEKSIHNILDVEPQ